MTSHRLVSLVAVSLALGLATTQLTCSAISPAGDQQQAANQTPTTCLNNLRKSAMRIRTAALDILNDVEQRPMETSGSDPLFIVPPTYDQKDSAIYLQDMKALGALEKPHKRWLDADMARLTSLLKLFNSEMDNIAESSSTSAQVGAMKLLGKDVDAHYTELQALTAGPNYDNLAIGAAAMRIYDDMAKLEKPWKETVKAVRAASK